MPNPKHTLRLILGLDFTVCRGDAGGRRFVVVCSSCTCGLVVCGYILFLVVVVVGWLWFFMIVPVSSLRRGSSTRSSINAGSS